MADRSRCSHVGSFVLAIRSATTFNTESTRREATRWEVTIRSRRSSTRVVTVERDIPASAAVRFDILRRPAFHLRLDSSGMLRGAPAGPDVLGPDRPFQWR